MDSAAFLAHLRDELASFAACLTGDLSRPVRHCGSWTLHDLAEHLGQENEWVVAAVTELRGDYQGAGAPREPAALAGWFDGTVTRLLAVLGQDPEQQAWTIYPPPTVGFWRRRRCLETLVHRWDAEQARGRRSVFNPALAAEGVVEVIDTMFPRQVKLDRAVPPERALRLRATDAGGADWILGTGSPAATVSADAQSLLLLLWRRLAPDDPGLSWDGDLTAGRAALSRPLTP